MSLFPATNGHLAQGKASQNAAWTISVREFFSAIAWSGESAQPSSQPTNAVEVPSPDVLDMRLTVNDFFNCFAWEGKPNIAVPVAPLEARPDLTVSGDGLTLDGFADLF
ncbi:MAG: hypothetical protein F6K42_02910 [Leptolyngbya sp. SIO1D8]|nr:hypothetical protein [Leptolyngbya sp. SIO1D8]